MPEPYTVTKADDVSFEIRNAEGQVVPQDTSCQDFLEFLRWNSFQGPALDRDICQFPNLYLPWRYKKDVSPRHAGRALAGARFIPMSLVTDRVRHISEERRFHAIKKHNFCLLTKASPILKSPDYELRHHHRQRDQQRLRKGFLENVPK